MNLDRVTITGADDSIQPSQLLELSKQFRFVEWGILMSASNMGQPRYPSMGWLEDLDRVAAKAPDLRLSLHYCGRWTREFMNGRDRVREHFPTLHSRVQRIQVNFHREQNLTLPESFRCVSASAES